MHISQAQCAAILLDRRDDEMSDAQTEVSRNLNVVDLRARARAVRLAGPREMSLDG